MSRVVIVACCVSMLPLSTVCAQVSPAPPVTMTQRTARRAVGDSLEGHVSGDVSGSPLAGAHVVLENIASGAATKAVSDATGAYTIAFPHGRGEVALRVTALGFAPFATTLTPRIAGDSTVYAMDIHLQSVALTLSTVRIRASRRSKPSLRDYGTSDVGGSAADVGEFGMSPSDAGDLTAMAASVPGVVLVPDANGGPPGFSVLGVSPTQNAVTLNGLTFGGSQIPSAAYTSTRLETSAFDPSVGGFSGGLLATTLLAGSNYTFDFVTATLDDPALQLTDAAGDRFGQRFRNVILSGARRGPLVRDKLFYNISAQIGRRTNPLPSLLGANAGALSALGVSPSVRQGLLASLDSAGVPSDWVEQSQTAAQSGSVLGRFDIAPSATRTFDIVMAGNWRRATPMRIGPTALPSVGGSVTDWGGNLQAEYGRYIENVYLARVRSGVALSGTDGQPLSRLPAGTVLVGSTLASGAPGLATLGFGGATNYPSRLTKLTWETIGETSWFLPTNRHRPKIAAGLRLDRIRQDAAPDRSGIFEYQSLNALAANQPSAFDRTLSGGEWASQETSAWASAGDLWRLTSRIALQYGLRWEGNRFERAPTNNPAVGTFLGVANTSVPTTTHVSPRIGFTWAYGSAAGVGFSARPRGQVHGGIGEFRSVLDPALVGPALSRTGLPGAMAQLRCIGPAVPTPDWAAFAADYASIPTTCADSSTGFADTRPAVTLFLPGYQPGRAWRGTLGWSGAALRVFRVAVDGTFSLNLNQPSTEDLNFAGIPQFSLATEGRAVFAAPTQIDAASGGIAPAASRKTDAFSTVTALASDLRSEGTLVSLRVGPNAGFYASRYWTLGYTYAHTREQTRGFDGGAFGDPRTVSWSDGSTDIRHTFSASFSTALGNEAFFGISGQLRSGAPYTPLVEGDVNGDGLAGNDRAYIYSATSAPGNVAADLLRLERTAPSGARSCLVDQVDRPAVRNSCRGPWTLALWLHGTVSGKFVRLPERSQITMTVANPLTGLDYALHGQAHLRGWGQPSIPDPYLFVVKGFDPANRAFQYAVNPSFGTTRPSLNAFRAPFQVTLAITLPLNAPFGRQQLDDAIGPGRYRKGTRRTADEIRKMYAGANFYDPVRPILAARDSLLLTREQASALTAIGTRYYAATDTIWTVLSTTLATLDSGHVDRTEALLLVRDAKSRAYDALDRAAAAIRDVLTPDQLSMLAPDLQQTLDPRTLEKMRRTELRSYE